MTFRHIQELAQGDAAGTQSRGPGFRGWTGHWWYLLRWTISRCPSHSRFLLTCTQFRNTFNSVFFFLHSLGNPFLFSRYPEIWVLWAPQALSFLSISASLSEASHLVFGYRGWELLSFLSSTGEQRKQRGEPHVIFRRPGRLMKFLIFQDSVMT